MLQSCLANLKDILLLYDCIKFELHIFCSLGKIRTNNISPRISDRQLVIFAIIGEFEKPEYDIF